jgi:hypothetical protein
MMNVEYEMQNEELAALPELQPFSGGGQRSATPYLPKIRNIWFILSKIRVLSVQICG